jgi:hypothetical protein
MFRQAFAATLVAPPPCAGIIGYRSLRVAGVEPGKRVGFSAFEAPPFWRFAFSSLGNAMSMLLREAILIARRLQLWALSGEARE